MPWLAFPFREYDEAAHAVSLLDAGARVETPRITDLSRASMSFCEGDFFFQLMVRTLNHAKTNGRIRHASY